MRDNEIETSKQLPKNIAVISICEPVEESTHYFQEADNVLNLDFWDVNGFESYGRKGMTADDALKTIKFIENNRYKDFYIHCSAGMSRSQAVGKFLEDVFDCQVITKQPKFPNQHVYRLLKLIGRDLES